MAIRSLYSNPKAGNTSERCSFGELHPFPLRAFDSHLVEGLDAAFQIQQKLLPPKTATVSAEFAVLIHHPVARNRDRNSIQSIRVAHSALRGG